MFTRHVSRQLAAYIDGELSLPEAARIERHAAQCADCQAEREQVEFGMQSLERLSFVEPPEAVWISIEALLVGQVGNLRPIGNRPLGQASRQFLPRETFLMNVLRRQWLWAFSAAAAVGLLAVAGWIILQRARNQVDAVRLDGKTVAAGQWIETDSQSSARVKVGAIGSVEIEPNTRLRVVTARPGEHRLALARGEIRAKISAPPKLFFVDTASGTAVDLGCEYTLDADEEGSGLLRVTKGWVSFQWKGLESLVPAGASCRIQPRVGPGIPYFDDAPESLKQALERGALDAILAEARVRDTLTLWHLLQRVDAADRARVYDRIASLTPVPAGVSREQALKLDPETLRLWKEELAWTW